MYKIVLKKKAKKFIDKLPLNEKKRIVAAIEKLPEGEDIKKLQGYDNVLHTCGKQTLYSLSHLEKRSQKADD